MYYFDCALVSTVVSQQEGCWFDSDLRPFLGTARSLSVCVGSPQYPQKLM